MIPTTMDVVCLVEVDEDESLWVSEHDGKLYHFCARHCKDLFDADPGFWTEEG